MMLYKLLRREFFFDGWNGLIGVIGRKGMDLLVGLGRNEEVIAVWVGRL